MLQLVSLHPPVLRASWFPKECLGDLEFMLPVVGRNGSHFQFASEELKADRRLALAAIRQDPFCLRFATDSIKGDVEIVVQAYDENAEVLRYIAPEMKDSVKNFRQIWTLHAPGHESEDAQDSLRVRATKLNGEVAAEVVLLESQSVGDLKAELRGASALPAHRLEFVLPCGESLSSFSDARPLSETPFVQLAGLAAAR